MWNWSEFLQECSDWSKLLQGRLGLCGIDLYSFKTMWDWSEFLQERVELCEIGMNS